MAPLGTVTDSGAPRLAKLTSSVVPTVAGPHVVFVVDWTVPVGRLAFALGIGQIELSKYEDETLIWRTTLSLPTQTLNDVTVPGTSYLGRPSCPIAPGVVARRWVSCTPATDS